MKFWGIRSQCTYANTEDVIPDVHTIMDFFLCQKAGVYSSRNRGSVFMSVKDKDTVCDGCVWTLVLARMWWTSAEISILGRPLIPTCLIFSSNQLDSRTRSFSHTYTHTHARTHARTHTHVCFYKKWGHPIGVMDFILYKRYMLLPYTYPSHETVHFYFPPKKLTLYDL